MSIANIQRQIPNVVYQSTFFPQEDQPVVREFVKNRTEPKDRGIVNTFSELNSRTKGVADSFALIGRSAKFMTPYMTAEVADLTHHVSNSVLKARSVLSLPFMWTAVRQFNEKMSLRNGCQLIATSCHSLALFVLGAATKTISAVGSLFKAFVDSHDFVDTTKKFFETKELCVLASKGEGASEEVKSGLNSQWYEQVFKIIKLSLAALSGLVTGCAFCLELTLPVALGSALLVATIVSALFSILADYTVETADYVPFKA
ncbi:MAG TPA: hypothetical protein VHL30_00585 [Chlamydiales bacterium]|jgi:hypothetical protein|nr:hypothetical protein [Chlamydiales bacterium]